MSKTTETSVTFSLKELLQLEEDRIANESRHAAEQREKDRQSQIAIERAAMARKLAEAERQERLAQQKHRQELEEQASLEAIRIQSEVAAKMAYQSAEDARRRAHEANMAQLALADVKRTRKAMAAGMAAGMVFGLLLGAIGHTSHVQNDKIERQMWQSKIAEAEEKLTTLSQAPCDQQILDGNANDEGQKKDTANQKGQPKPRPAQVINPRQHSPKPTTANSQPCAPGDPLCGNL